MKLNVACYSLRNSEFQPIIGHRVPTRNARRELVIHVLVVDSSSLVAQKIGSGSIYETVVRRGWLEVTTTVFSILATPKL